MFLGRVTVQNVEDHDNRTIDCLSLCISFSSFFPRRLVHLQNNNIKLPNNFPLNGLSFLNAQAAKTVGHNNEGMVLFTLRHLFVINGILDVAGEVDTVDGVFIIGLHGDAGLFGRRCRKLVFCNTLKTCRL